MAPEAGRHGLSVPCLAVLLTLAAAAPAHAVRVVNWNLLNYPGTTAATRNPHYRTVLQPLAPDVVVVQEITSQAGVNQFRDQVLNTLEPGAWASAPFTDGTDTDNGLFYKPSKVQFLGQRAFYVSSDLERFVNEYRLKPVGYASDAAEIRIYSVHLKASTGSTNVAQRLREATGLRDTLNNAPPGTHTIVTGDFNIYSGAEGAFGKFLESQAVNTGRLYDPLNAPLATWNNAAYTWLHTQSPCNSGCAGGFATGGLDDRFDMFLPTYNLGDGEGLDLLVETYVPVGNDTQHYNLNIIDAPEIPEGAAYAAALFGASDHLPIRVDLRLPARIDVAATPIAFGSVIVGATADRLLAVANPAEPPADTLEYAYTAPAGFVAPAGTLARLAGGASDDVIALDTSAPGAFAGDLVLASNDLDTPLRTVPVSGTVLAHAVASLDSLELIPGRLLDFGAHPSGGFSPRPVRVHNLGYNPLQARLQVLAAAFTGRDAARFTLSPAFTPALVAGTSAGWEVSFDDAGAEADSEYVATLAFACADEPLPGGAAQPALTLALRARLTGASVAVEGPLAPPAATLLHAPFPNPVRGGTTVRFDLATPGHARVEVYDLAGRRLRGLEDRGLAAGRYAVRWDGTRDDGTVAPAGLYFVRLSGDGLGVHTARVVVVR
jgi:hypothetical protein